MDFKSQSIELTVMIHGCQHYPHSINHGHAGLTLIREPSKYDDHAIRVVDGDKTVGFIGKQHAKNISPLLDTFLFECASVTDVRVLNLYHMRACIHLKPLPCVM